MGTHRHSRPNVVRLESRDVLSTFHIPWADPSHLSISFVPDGTDTPGGPSTVGQVIGDSAGAREILRAAQTWAVQTNINISVTTDGGQAIGSTGTSQGDSRFGDLRIAAAPLSADVLASSTPFGWSGSTLAGDVVFNSTAVFSKSTNDLYSVALHELGHSFGLDHSQSTDSVLFESYRPYSGLGAPDVQSIQSLYGVRMPDANEGTRGNETIANATTLKTTSLLGRVASDGDLTTMSDVDVYSLTTLPTAGLSNITVRLQAKSLSLVTAKVSVYNSFGTLVTTQSATDPANNDLTLTFNNASPNAKYFVSIEGANNDVFNIGAYRITVDTVTLTTPLPALNSLLNPVLDSGLNETLQSATDLRAQAPADQRFDAIYRGSIETNSDVDVYKVRAPQSNGSSLNVMVWASQTSTLNPTVHVYDRDGNAVPYRVLGNDARVFSVEVANVTAGQDYFVSVEARETSGSNRTGAYFLGVDFNTFEKTTFEGVASGSITPTNSIVNASIQVTDAAWYQFGLNATGATAQTVVLTIRNDAGQIVDTLRAGTGKSMATKVVFLKLGRYSLSYALSGPTSQSVNYNLYLSRLSDDVGTYSPKPSRPTEEPPPQSSSASSGTTYEGSSTPPPASEPYYF
jgi:hypothetical protein